MKDLTIALENRPGALAEMGEALRRAGVSVEGGSAWVVGGQGVAHFLVADGRAARSALESAGIPVLAERDVVVQRLKQDVPGQLGLLTRRMADAGVNIEVLYSDHDLGSDFAPIGVANYDPARLRDVREGIQRGDLVLRRDMPLADLQVVLRLYDRTTAPQRRAACL